MFSFGRWQQAGIVGDLSHIAAELSVVRDGAKVCKALGGSVE